MQPSESRAAADAPQLRRSVAISRCSHAHAMCSAVIPSQFCASSGAPFRESAFPGTNLKAAVLQWLVEAVANGKQPGWKAPRWLAQEGQKCTYAPA